MERLHASPDHAEQPVSAVQSGCSTKLRVHLVDDNQEAVDSLARWMALSGYETHVSYSGLEALATAPVFQPDVMLIDIVLPGMDGYQLAYSLQEKDEFKKVVFMAVTGLAGQEYQNRSPKPKFDLFFAKPVDLEILNGMLAGFAKKKVRR